MGEPIRVLQVFGKLNRGGAETMIMNLYRNIDRSKVQFDFIVHTEENCDYDEEIKALGGRIYRIPRYIGKNHFEYKKAWHYFFKNHNEYEIVHGHMRSTASIYLRIAKKYRLITIAHSHNTSSGIGVSAIAKNILQYFLRYIADYMFACSSSAGKWLFGCTAHKRDNFFVLKNAIDTNKFIFDSSVRYSKRKELKIEDKFVIGHIGRFHPQKNHEFLIDIFKFVHDNNKSAVLLLVGEGNRKKSIEKKVNELGLNNSVVFTGVRSDIPEIMQAMDVFALPSLYEGLGIVAIEAQAAGVKCFASSKRIPEEAKISELLEYVPIAKGSQFWAEKILAYENGYDRRDMSKFVRDAGYDINQTANWLEKFYLQNVRG